ncbi:HAL/PAL/TAL family ammonia-lyase [Paraburkholderia elongata]|uniref:Sugar transporter n=1 Tax=Paraburkholderia elongata TaxID=2675747 RepID=A0A972SHK4_9BURK|nr:aromatic amino acid lyase [Paraburkholderia elongata]NPT53590.1 sugar transporter [Paraburkholderia elongata]
MLRPIRCAIIAATLVHAPFSFADVVLDGHSATPEIIASIADGEAISIAPVAMKRVEAAHTVLLESAQAGQQIYGLTTGVGENKDRSMVDAKGKLTQEIIDASGRFNVGLIHAHSGSVGPDMDVRTARAAMAARLNAMLNGGAGVQASIVDTYVQFLNRGVTPAMPSGGSLGEADITILSHVGLAMLGEGDVYYQGRKIPAAEALDAAGIKPIKPYGKDALAILSSNAYSAGMAALALDDMGHLLKVSKLVYALSLQAFNGNVSPFLQDTLALRPFAYTVRAGEELRTLLAGSSIWNRDDKRALQDPLSYRDGVYLLGEEERAYAGAQALLNVQLNSSDDNPGVAVGVKAHSARWQDRRGYVDANGVTGAVLPSANFEPLPWVLSFEELGLVLGHNSLASAQRIMKLNDPQRSGLSRFLGTEQTVHAFGAMEKPPVALAEANKELAMPVSMDYLPVAGDIEDIATNAPRVVERVQQQIDNSFTLLGIELIHAGQAVDLRKQQQPDFTLSPATAGLYTALRGKVAFLDRDRPLTPDFRAAAALLHAYPG